MSKTDIDPLDEQIARERDYRRGFHQGAFFAVDAIRRGTDLGVVARWVQALGVWRRRLLHRGNPSRDVPPPCPKGREL